VWGLGGWKGLGGLRVMDVWMLGGYVVSGCVRRLGGR